MFTKEVPEVGKITTIENGKAHFNADKTYHHVRVFLGKEKVHLLLTDKDIEKALYRVKKNFDDIELQIPPDKTVFTSNLCCAIYSGLVTVGLVTALVARFLGV